MMRALLFSFTGMLLLLLLSCRRDGFTDNPDARLQTGQDTVHFDTVFTSTGSASQVFKIFNPNREGIRISSVKLAGGATSPFQINADGLPGPEVKGLEIAGGDSLYVFVTVRVDPTAAALPFVLRDSISINYNGRTEQVQLEAYGQNAHFFRGRILKTSETWNNDLPYVILDGLLVDTTATLTINKGVKVYFHADAPLLVNGSLHVLGDSGLADRVLFTGDRLDQPYRDFPASFPGLLFLAPSTNNLLQYAMIKNAYQAVVVSEPATSGTKLNIQETIIDNAYDAGLIGINTSIRARNLLISNSGKNLLLVKGGQYDFTHCTVAAYSNAYTQHKNPALTLTNNMQVNGATVVNPLTASFTNCIFWGEANGIVDDEVVLSRVGTAAFSVNFNQVLWRVRTRPAATITGDINNQDPRFDSLNHAQRIYSFRLSAGSPALEKGIATPVMLDLDGLPRPVGLPDLGAFERR